MRPFVRLRRGVVSRLVGDGLLGALGSSQFLLLVALIIVVPLRPEMGWVAVALLIVPAFVGVTLSYSLRGSHLVATVCGVPVTVLDVTNASAGVDETVASRGLRIPEVYVADAVVVRRFPFGAPDDQATIRLGYSRAIGPGRRQAWLRAIRVAADSTVPCTEAEST